MTMLPTNELPRWDFHNRPTGCCPVFDPRPWQDTTLIFREKRFLRVTTHSVLYIPLDMGRVFGRVQAAIEANDCADGYFVMSRDLSRFTAEHLFAVTEDVPGFESVRLSGEFRTTVFEGPFSQAGNWHRQMREMVDSQTPEVWFFYTTCPRCAKAYGTNYVVGLVRTA